MDLSGHIGLVTGSSQGIGRGCVLEMAKAGADVAINYRSNKAEAEEVLAAVEAMGRKGVILQADVAKQEDITRLFDEAEAALGPIDLFVSNAAYSDREKMLEADLDGFRRTIDVCMWGAFYAMREAALRMTKRNQPGAITIVSSPHAFMPVPGAMAYNMAKAAIDQMMRTAAIELASHNIRVNGLHPGWIDTPGERKFFTEEQLQEGAAALPMQRLGNINEIGRAVTYTLSPDAAYMTGSILKVDGGVTLPWWSKRDEGKQ